MRTKTKIGLVLTVLGFLLLSMNPYLPSRYHHLEYEESDRLGVLIQTYVVENMLGESLNYDVFFDLAGYLLLVAVGVLFFRYGKRFLYGQLFGIASMALLAALTWLPFHVNGKDLTVAGLVLSFFLMVAHILMGYHILYGITEASFDLSNEANGRYAKMGFIGASICHVTRYFLILVGLGALTVAYQFALMGFMVFCLYNVCKLEGGWE